MNEREIFTEALLRPNKALRAAYLDKACGQDAALRSRVEQLLALHESGDALLDRRPAELLDALGETTAGGDAGAAAAAEASAKQLAAYLAPATRPESLGRLGHYEVLRVLGQGAFGIVVKAFDTTLHRIVAIKTLAPHLTTTSPPRKRFLREACAAARVRHEHVVQIYAVEEQPLPYLVMELVEGQTLQQRLDATGPLDAPEAVRLGRQIALGLAAAHGRGLIHRDVKPANILLEAGAEPRVKLTDFGLARASDDASMSQSGVVVGTPMYMAPEQAQGARLDRRADLFSLGSVLYTMATGRPPFRARNTLAILKRVAEDTPRPIREVIADVPEGLCAVISRLLEKNPAARFASAEEAAEALSRCLTGPAPPPARLRRAPLRRAVYVAAALLLLGGAALIAGRSVGLMNRGDGPPQDARPAGVGVAPALAAGAVVPGTRAEPVPDRAPPREPAPARPAGDAWERAVALMDAEDQVTAVVAKLKKLNPDFDTAGVGHRVENGVVVGFMSPRCDGLHDISPLRALSGLKEVEFVGGGVPDIGPLRGLRLVRFTTNGCPIQDLKPLAGMPLETLNLWGFRDGDLSPLRGMRLRGSNLGASPVNDISVLKGMPLEALCLNYSQVEDLSPLAGMQLRILEAAHCNVKDLTPLAKLPLETLAIDGSPIADYTPLRGLPLKKIKLDYEPQRHAKLLRSIPTLETINDRPAAEVLGDDGL